MKSSDYDFCGILQQIRRNARWQLTSCSSHELRVPATKLTVPTAGFTGSFLFHSRQANVDQYT
jgi:hypothetical protein